MQNIKQNGCGIKQFRLQAGYFGQARETWYNGQL